MNKKIVISGWYGFGNIGDEAILQAMIDTFEKEYPKCNITVLSYNPEYTKRVQRVDAVYQIPIGKKSLLKNIISLRWIATLKAIKNCDIFIMGGGGFLSDWQPEVPKGWLKQMKLAKFFGKKTMLYGIGAGPFLTDRGKKTTKYYIDNFVDKITVRDTESHKQLVENVGININKVTLTYDPVIKWNLEKYKLNETRKDLVTVILTPHFDRPIWKDSGERWLKLYDCYIELIKTLQYENKKVRLMFFQESWEKEFSLRLQKDLDNVEISFPIDYREAITFMSESESIISFRLHGNILAYVLNKPFLPIIYHHKTAGFLENINYLKTDVVIEVGEGLNWKDLPIDKKEWRDKTKLFCTLVEKKENFYEK